MYHLITQEFINDCNGYIDIMRKLGLKVKPGRVPKIHNQIELFNLDITHFNNDNRRSRYDVARICRICNKSFYTREQGKHTRRCCSLSCTKEYYLKYSTDGIIQGNYRTLCFQFHEKKCVVCENPVKTTVHHYDEDRTHNDPRNLVPICYEHHNGLHGEIDEVVQLLVDDYRDKFLELFDSS